MSTRAQIARADGNDWRGVTHRWGGYPEELGRALWALYHGRYGHDLGAMLAELIDAHPGGWRTITEADWSKPIGHVAGPVTGTAGPQCYCHGDGHHRGYEHTKGSNDDTEWAYEFAPDNTMAVHYRNTAGAWLRPVIVELEGTEPNWASIAERGMMGLSIHIGVWVAGDAEHDPECTWPHGGLPENDGCTQDRAAPGEPTRLITYESVSAWHRRMPPVKALFDAMAGDKLTDTVCPVSRVYEQIMALPNGREENDIDRVRWLKYWAGRAREEYGEAAVIELSV